MAYQAIISSLKVIDSRKHATDTQEAEALGYRPDLNRTFVSHVHVRARMGKNNLFITRFHRLLFFFSYPSHVQYSLSQLLTNELDIYSSSWGPIDDAQRLEGPGPLLMRVFEHNIFKERNGLGSIYIWANGNGGSGKDKFN